MDGKPFLAEWLKSLENTHSAWTVNTYGSGLSCVYGIQKTDIDFTFPKRCRKDITRSRAPLSYENSDPKFDDARLFCKATGARRCGIMRIRIHDIRQKEDGTYEVFLREKNNMKGWRQVLPQYQEEILCIFQNSAGFQTPNGEIRLFRKNALPTELHSFRARYACELYQFYETNKLYITGKNYYCRKDMAGLVFDRGILQAVSEQMFHHRLDVIVTNYLYGFK